MATDVVVTTTRLVVRHAPGDDPFAPGRWHDLVVAHRENPHPSDARVSVGTVGIRVEAQEPTVEVRIELHATARGNGYATEVLTAVVDHALTTRAFARVVAIAPAADERSHRLLERAGLRAVAADGDDLVFLARARRTAP